MAKIMCSIACVNYLYVILNGIMYRVKQALTNILFLEFLTSSPCVVWQTLKN